MVLTVTNYQFIPLYFSHSTDLLYFLEFQQTVLASLTAIQTTNDQILLTIQEILRYNKKI